MLPSPPLTADSGTFSPRSLKRTFTDATDDATPPPSQPLKRRRRGSASEPLATIQQDIWTGPTNTFDPSKLVTPPEYAHIPYDPNFGAKVCSQYKKSLQTKRACDAIVLAARRHKYGQEDALAYSPGSTPDHIRRSYEEKQRKLDQLAEDIIANSDSESEAEPELDSDEGWTIGRRVVRKGTPEVEVQMSETEIGLQKREATSRDRPPRCIAKRPHRGVPFKLRSHDINEETRYEGVGVVSHGRVRARCTLPARSEFGSFRSRSRDQVREGFSSSIRLVAS